MAKDYTIELKDGLGAQRYSIFIGKNFGDHVSRGGHANNKKGVETWLLDFLKTMYKPSPTSYAHRVPTPKNTMLENTTDLDITLQSLFDELAKEIPMKKMMDAVEKREKRRKSYKTESMHRKGSGKRQKTARKVYQRDHKHLKNMPRGTKMMRA